MKLIEQIEKHNPCAEATEWLGDRDLETAWAECQRGDWMLWLATRGHIAQGSLLHRAVVRAGARCAETALQYTRESDRVVCKNAIDSALAWADNPCPETTRAAYDAARAAEAARAARAYAAARAARAAAYAAYAAAEAAYAAYDAAEAAEAARAKCAEIVRATVPLTIVREAMEAAA